MLPLISLSDTFTMEVSISCSSAALIAVITRIALSAPAGYFIDSSACILFYFYIHVGTQARRQGIFGVVNFIQLNADGNALRYFYEIASSIIGREQGEFGACSCTYRFHPSGYFQ